MMETDFSTRENRPSRCLSAENLAADFGIRSPIALYVLPVLHEAISQNENVYLHWHKLFISLWGPAEAKILGPLKTTLRKLKIANGQPLPFLFALQTYYALLLGLLVKRFENLRRYDILDPPFSWFLESECSRVRSMIDRIDSKMADYDFQSFSSCEHGATDLLKNLHHSLFSRAIRHHLGEYYTPDWLADHLLEKLDFDDRTPGRLLDPACGSGTFLMAALRRIRNSQFSRQGKIPDSNRSILRKILKSVVGIDLNPLATMSARANYLIAIHDLLSADDPPFEIPVYLGDSILGTAQNDLSGFDFVAGNPPWIAWDNLPDDYRAATKPLWEKYGLFSLSGNAARHGGGKKDLSMLMLYAVADKYLKSAGRLGFVITQTLFQTKGAGDGFRRFRLGNGDPLKVLHVDDLTAIKPFEDAANWTSLLVLEKGSETTYPVPYIRWNAGQVVKLKVGNLPYEKTACTASPIDPRRPTSPWLVRPVAENGSGSSLIAPSAADYEAHLGANSGGANGVYWVELLGEAHGGVRVRNVVEKCKKTIERIEAIIEPDLLFPLLRWSDLDRYSPLPCYHLLLVQDCQRRVGLDESLLKRDFPLTYDYLRRFEALLTARAAYRRYQGGQPFYSMYNVGPYTTAECKVVWRRMDKRLNAAVVEPIEHPLLGRRSIVPQETCVLIDCRSADESHYLCALLNSEPAGELLASHSVRSGKGFGTPSILDYLPLGRYDAENALHRELSLSSREAHRLTKNSISCDELQKTIDRLSLEAFSQSPSTGQI